MTPTLSFMPQQFLISEQFHIKIKQYQIIFAPPHAQQRLSSVVSLILVILPRLVQHLKVILP